MNNITPHTTIVEMLEEYRTACYGDAELSPVQSREVNQAFLAGCACMLELTGSIAQESINEETAIEALDRVHTELITLMSPPPAPRG